MQKKRTFKNMLIALLAFSMIATNVFGFGSPAKVQAENDDNTLIVGFDASFPPYGYKDENGEYIGFDLDLAAEVCERNGWTLVKQPIDWDSKDMELNSESIDCIWNGFTINGRENDYTWSVPYVDNSQVVVVKKDSGISTLSDLAGKVVAVQTGSSALAAFTGDGATDENIALCASFKELQQIADYNGAFMNLESDMVDAICMDIGVANYQIQARGDQFVMLDEQVSSEQYGIGFKKGNEALKDKVEKALFEMVADGTFDQIATEWGLSDCTCLAEYMAETPASDLLEENKFVVGFDASFPPYGYKDENGEYIGFDLDLAAEVCERNGWTLVKQPIDWDSKDMELNSGSINCIWNGFTINGRENDYTWSVPYVDNSQVVIVKKDSGIEHLSDLAGKVVAVQTGSSALASFTGDGATPENIALCESFEELQQIADYNGAFMNLESDMVDAICMDIGVANYQIQARGGQFIMLDEQVSSEQYGIGFKKGNEALRDKVQATLFEMVEDGTFDKIAKAWGLSDCTCLAQYASGEAPVEDTTEEGTNAVEAPKSSVWSIVQQLSEGMLATLAVFFLTLLFSLPLGLLITFVRMSKFKLFQWIARIYISIMRGTPLMLQLLVVFFGPYYLFDAHFPHEYRFYAVIIGFSMNYAAYFAEIFRAGIQDVPAGQREAAAVLGYSRTQTFAKIVFPQMVKKVMPPVTNEVITLVKDTSLAYALAYTEMFTLAKQIADAQTTMLPLFIAGVFYYVFNFLVAAVMEAIEKKMDYYR